MKKDQCYLQAFSVKILKEARRILEKGFTAKDITEYLKDHNDQSPVRRVAQSERAAMARTTAWGPQKKEN